MLLDNIWPLLGVAGGSVGFVALLAAGGLLYCVYVALYNLFFHPLSRFPGPITYATSSLPWTWHTVRGNFTKSIAGDLHRKYGKVVRITPNRLIFADSAAFRDIYVHKTPDGRQNIKDPGKFAPDRPGVPNGIVHCDDATHMRYRRIFSPAFSVRAISAQESLVLHYIDFFVSGLKEASSKGPQRMTDWLEWTTFDIIGDLTFGEPFGGLVQREAHPWVNFFFDHTKLNFLASHLRVNVPLFKYVEPLLTNKESLRRRHAHAETTKSKVESRWHQGETARPDFMSLVWQEEGKSDPLRLEETYTNAVTIVIAGSDTTATLLSGLLYMLCKTPTAYNKLRATVRDTFAQDSDINATDVTKLEYVTACIREALRLYPPVPTESERRIMDPAGQTVAGEYVPEGTWCGLSQFAANRLETSFHRASEFLPQRWLGDEEFANDERDLAQPFLLGPRNCIGQSLAWMELRLMVAKMMFHFDFELVHPEQDWIAEQKVYLLWEKIPLWMKVKPVR